MVREVFDASDGNYGVPRMHRELRRGGLVVNVKRVHRLMRRHGRVGRFHNRRVVTTIAGATAYVIPDLIGRRFAPGAPNTAWCQDITYIATGDGWLYMASVVDIGSRRLLGYSVADHMRTELVTDALRMAIGARDHHVNGVIVYADRGTQGGFNRSSQQRLVGGIGDARRGPLPGSSSQCFAGPTVDFKYRFRRTNQLICIHTNTQLFNG